MSGTRDVPGADTVAFRRATAADLPAIVALLADDALGAVREAVGDPPAAAYVAAFAALDADPNQELIVGDRRGEVVACLQLTFIPGLSRRGLLRAQIESVRVARTARGGGLGHRLFEHAIARAHARGAGLVQLTTDVRRSDAHRFYERLGFTPSHVGMKLDLAARPS